MTTKNALRSHDGCNDVRLHDTRNLDVLDQFQKVYLFLLMTSFGNMEKDARRTAEKSEFCKQHVLSWICVAHQKYLEERSDECKN